VKTVINLPLTREPRYVFLYDFLSGNQVKIPWKRLGDNHSISIAVSISAAPQFADCPLVDGRRTLSVRMVLRAAFSESHRRDNIMIDLAVNISESFLTGEHEDWYLPAGRLAPYKRQDLLVLRLLLARCV
jgi:hypothetical protein